jgi:hypothetical protein
MHKNQYVIYTTISAIAVSAILLTSFTVGGVQFSQHALAQNATNATNATSAAPSNATSATTQPEPAIGQSFVWQGTKSSVADPVATGKKPKDQVVWVLQPRSDGAVYSGVLTYTASKSANVQIWHNFSPGNTTAFPKSFGKVTAAPYQGKDVAVSDISTSGSSGSVPFSGNAIVLHAKSPFTATFTVNAVAQTSKTINNVQSAMAAATPPPTTTTKSSTSGGNKTK